jgi:hypothetical protein
MGDTQGTRPQMCLAVSAPIDVRPRGRRCVCMCAYMYTRARVCARACACVLACVLVAGAKRRWFRMPGFRALTLCCMLHCMLHDVLRRVVLHVACCALYVARCA